MSDFSDVDKTAILGRSGCGKSHLGKLIQERYPRKLVIDSLHEYDDKDFDFVVTTPKSLVAAMLAVQKADKFSILFRFDLEADDAETVEQFNFICWAVFNFGNILFVIEEIHLYSSPHDLPIWLRNIATMGRHKKIALVLTSQRAGLTNKNLLANCTRVYCGQMIDRNDQSYIATFIGRDARELSELPDRNFIQFDSREPKNIKIVKNDFLKTRLDSHLKQSVTKRAGPKTKKQEQTK